MEKKMDNEIKTGVRDNIGQHEQPRSTAPTKPLLGKCRTCRNRLTVEFAIPMLSENNLCDDPTRSGTSGRVSTVPYGNLATYAIT